jgi:hypothetical protein
MGIKNKIMSFFASFLLGEEERNMFKNIPSPEQKKENSRKRVLSLDSLVIKMGIGGECLDMCFEPHFFVSARKKVLENPKEYPKDIYEIALSYTEEQIELETKTYYKRMSSRGGGGSSSRNRGRNSSRTDNYDFNTPSNPSSPSNLSNYD